jgi:hypothetical protein
MTTAGLSRAAGAAALVVACLCWWPGAIAAGPGDALAVRSIGFDGRVRMATWTPMWVEVRAPAAGVDGTVTLTAASPTGSPVVQQTVSVRAAPGATLRIFLPATLYDARTPGTLTLAEGGRTLATAALSRVVPADEIIVVLSDEPLGLEATSARGQRTEVAYVTPDNLPPIWQAYDGVRLVVVRNVDERRLGDPQRRALQQWIWSGGRLLVMPSGDDLRHFQGPTLRDLVPVTAAPLRARAGTEPYAPKPGAESLDLSGVRGARWQIGRGRVTVIGQDVADPARRGGADDRRAWDAILDDSPSPAVFELDATLPPQRPVPARTQLLVGVLIVGYIAAARRLSRLAAALRAPMIISAILVVAAATVIAARAAVFARADASGVVASAVAEGLPGTRYAIMAMSMRMVVSHPGDFVIGARGEMLLRPVPTASVALTYDARTLLKSGAPGLRLIGLGIVPMDVTGTLAPRDDGGTLTVENRAGAPLDPVWVYQAGRIQAVGAIGGSAQIAIDGQRWIARDRLQRTDPNHALLVWAFSHLEGDAILKMIPTWLIGWVRDPASSLTWEGRREVTPHLVLVPLTSP